jgi:hypothetical protein
VPPFTAFGLAPLAGTGRAASAGPASRSRRAAAHLLTVEACDHDVAGPRGLKEVEVLKRVADAGEDALPVPAAVELSLCLADDLWQLRGREA